MAFLRKHPTYVFVVYRIALAVLLIVLAATGAVQPR
jgi:undecaprenyl pyrophosphate phosphatase UppP